MEEKAVPTPPMPVVSATTVSSAAPGLPAELRALRLAASVTGDERMFQQVHARV